MMSTLRASFLSLSLPPSRRRPRCRLVARCPDSLFLCQCIVGSRPQLPAGPPCVRAPIRKPRHTTWPCTRICTHKYRGGKKGEEVHPLLRAPGRDSCLGDANISEKDIDALVLNFKEDAMSTLPILILTE